MTPIVVATQGFQIVTTTQVASTDVLTVINEAFGAAFDESWFLWKHVESPFGSSLGWVALDESGVIGVRLFLRWEILYGGRVVHALRPVDTATRPKSRHRGIFTALTASALSNVEHDARVDLIFNTPNYNSRLGYERMGWTLLPPIKHAVKPLLPIRTVRIEQDDLVFRAFDENYVSDHRFRTARSSRFARWRYDARSGVEYGAARLREANEPNAIVYRIVKRKWGRLLVVNELVGSHKERAALLMGVAREEGSVAALVAAGPGSFETTGGWSLTRGGSVLAVRPLRHFVPDPVGLDSWALTLGDLERVI